MKTLLPVHENTHFCAFTLGRMKPETRADEGSERCCLLVVVCCLLVVVCCLLFVVCCLLFVVCCLLFVVCCL